MRRFESCRGRSPSAWLLGRLVGRLPDIRSRRVRRDASSWASWHRRPEICAAGITPLTCSIPSVLSSAPHTPPEPSPSHARCRSARQRQRIARSCDQACAPLTSSAQVKWAFKHHARAIRKDRLAGMGAGAGRPGRARQLANHRGRFAGNGPRFDDAPSQVVTSLGGNMDARVAAAMRVSCVITRPMIGADVGDMRWVPRFKGGSALTRTAMARDLSCSRSSG